MRAESATQHGAALASGLPNRRTMKPFSRFILVVLAASTVTSTAHAKHHHHSAARSATTSPTQAAPASISRSEAALNNLQRLGASMGKSGDAPRITAWQLAASRVPYQRNLGLDILLGRYDRRHRRVNRARGW
jgi:hypothetical protein